MVHGIYMLGLQEQPSVSLWEQILQPVRDALPVHHPALIFAIAMLVILIAPMVMRRIHMPGLVGVLLFGAILGPHALNVLARDNTMVLFETVGLLYLMYLAGLSLDLNQFAKLRNRSIVFGILSFSIPMLLAVLIGINWLGYNWLQALLLGSIVASHTLVAYPTVKRLGIIRNTALIMATGGTLLTDALSLSILAGVAAATEGQIGLMFWVQFLGLIGCYVVVVLFGLPLIGRWFFRKVQDDRSEFVFMLAVLFLCAYVSTLVGLAPIVGGFMAGLVMNRLVPENSSLMSRLQFTGEALFIPFFLLSVGMLVDVGVLVGSLTVWIYVLAFTFMVVVGKGLAAKLAQWIYGHTAEEGWAIAGLTIPQAAATLAVTLVGFDLGLFNVTEVNAIVVLILITCLIGPWLVERYGKAVALAEETQPYKPSDAPRRIAVPLANPNAAESLMDTAFLIQESNSRDPIYPLTVVSDGDNVAAQVAASERLLGYAVIHASAAGVPVTPVTRVDAHVASGIQRAFKELRIFTAVIGWDGKQSHRKRMFGGVLDTLIRDCSQQLLISRIVHPLNTTNRLILLVPMFADREVGFEEAMILVKRLAHQLGVKVQVLATESMNQRIEKRVKKLKPDVSFAYSPINGVSDGPGAVDPQVNENDLLLLLSSREGRVSWQPALGMLPQRLTREYPETSLLVLYPSELEPEQAISVTEPLEATTSPWKLLTEERVLLQLDNEDVDEVVDRMLQTQLKGDSDALKHALHALVESRRQIPIEVTTGVVLLHAHVPHVQEPTLFLATSSTGLTVDGISSQVYVVFVLLSPANLPPKKHLESLASIAHLMHDSTVVQRIYEARQVEDLRDILSRM